MWATARRGKQLGLGESIKPAMGWAVGAGFPAAHLFDVLAYRTSEFLANPAVMIDPARGWSISSYGGFLGAFLAVTLWCKHNNLPLLSYLDSLAIGITVGFVFGRLGCFFVHDHVGCLTNSFLSVAFPGGRRHDLGLDEFIFCLVLALWFLFLMRKSRPVGIYLALACITYGPVRFLLDFLRAQDIPQSDSRYFGLTPAQYFSIAIVPIGLWLSLALAHRKTSHPNLFHHEGVPRLLSE